MKTIIYVNCLYVTTESEGYTYEYRESKDGGWWKGCGWLQMVGCPSSDNVFLRVSCCGSREYSAD